MSSGLLLAFLISTGLVGWFAVEAWRTKAVVIAGQKFTRASSPRTYWAFTSFWTAAFAFQAYLVIDFGFSR